MWKDYVKEAKKRKKPNPFAEREKSGFIQS